MDEQQFRKEEETELSKQKEPWEDDGKKHSVSADLFDWAEALVYALAVLVVICAFFVRLSGVEGSSMYPTLHEGDQLLISSFGYGEPERGDIVVFQSDELDLTLVKRLVGLPGDHVVIGEDGSMILNGEPVEEDYVFYPDADPDHAGDFQVPEGHYLFMGDNRSGSNDARLWEEPYIAGEKITGRAVFTIWPLGNFGLLR